MATRSKNACVGKSRRGSDYSRWMEKLPQELREAPLNQLAIPGSHNSLTSCLESDGVIAVDQPPWIKALVSMVPTTGSIIYSWSTVQSLSVSDQLNAGIRYFDIRVAAKLDSGELCSVHGLYGPSIETSLNEIASFLDNHKSEVVFLDFNHFYQVGPVAHYNFVCSIHKRFGAKLCPVQKDAQDVTLKFMSDHSFQLIVFYHHPCAMKFPFLWPEFYIPSPWPEQIEVTNLLKTLENIYQQGRTMSKFHVTQGVLTPGATYIFTHLCTTLKDTLARDAARPFVEWLKSKTAGPGGINICIMDCVELENYIGEVIQLNYSLLQ